MHITYASRSKFFEPLERILEEDSQALTAGHVITVQLDPGGYNHKVSITINTNDPSGFATDWIGNDPTRFPARIRAAATVLFQKSYSGVFTIAHNNGIMEIQRT